MNNAIRTWLDEIKPEDDMKLTLEGLYHYAAIKLAQHAARN